MKLLTVASSIALLICFGLVLAWTRSIMGAEGVRVRYGDSSYLLASYGNAVVIERLQPVNPSPSGPRYVGWDLQYLSEAQAATPPLGDPWSIEMASWTRQGSRFSSGRWTVIQIPFWQLVLASGIGPAQWFYYRYRFRSHRISEGLCRGCGFMMGTIYYSCPNCGRRPPLLA